MCIGPTLVFLTHLLHLGNGRKYSFFDQTNDQFSSVGQSYPTLWPTDHNVPRFPVHHQLPELTQTHVHQVGGGIQPSHPLSSASPPAFDLTQQRVFSSELVLHIRWPKYWSFSFNISPSNEYSGLIPFRIDWFVLLAVQRTLQSLLQHHSSKASILQCSAFFMVQLSHPYMTTGKTIALTELNWTELNWWYLATLLNTVFSFSS